MEELIVKHLKDDTGREWPFDTIRAQPRYKRIWARWKALAYYKMNDTYERIEDAPEGVKWVTIMGDTNKLYAWQGKYVFIQEMDFKTCKSIYGE